MKKKSEKQTVGQPKQEMVVEETGEIEEINRIKAQIKELKQRNDHMEAEIKTCVRVNNLKKNTNNNLRYTFKKLCDEIEVLKVEHLTKVEENLKMTEGPVSDLIKENGFGLSPFALMKIPAFRYQKKQEADICMGCYEELQQNSKCKSLAGCEHVFHSQCIDQYLLVTKQCPACGVEVNL